MEVWFGSRGGVEEHGCNSFEGPERLSARGARRGMKKFAGIGICPPLLGGITLDFAADHPKYCCHFPYRESRDSPRVFRGTVPEFFEGQSPSFSRDSPRVFVINSRQIPTIMTVTTINPSSVVITACQELKPRLLILEGPPQSLGRMRSPLTSVRVDRELSRPMLRPSWCCAAPIAAAL